MKALTLIALSPIIVPVAVIGAFIGVARVALREVRLQREAKRWARQHIADVNAELAKHRAKVADGMRKGWLN